MQSTRQTSESGFAMMALLAVMLPLVFMVGTYLQTMAGRQGRLQAEIIEEQALLDAESGVDTAIYESRIGNLPAGYMARSTFRGDVPSGGTFEAVCTYLGDDDDDNDEDGLEDEPDEDVFRVVSTGRHGKGVRRVTVYLGFSSYLPTPGAAMSMLSQAPTDIRLSGNPILDGHNHTLAGVPTGSGDMPGLSIAPPAPTTQITNLLTGAERGNVTGSTPAPSVGQQSEFSDTIFDEVMNQARQSAMIVVNNANVANANWGNPTTGPQYIVYRNGDLRISGNVVGAGLLIVNGNLRITGTMNWYGVVMIRGHFECGAGTALITGATVMHSTGTVIDMRGTCDLKYSSDAILLAQNLTGRYVAFNGWQEVATN